MKIGDETQEGFIFDIKGDVVFECQKEDFHRKLNWEDANKLYKKEDEEINWNDEISKCYKGNYPKKIYWGDIWRLPTKEELNLMYLNLHENNIGGFADYFHWSSSEYDASNAWDQFFYNGLQYNTNKNYTLYVRAVRDFKIGE